MFKNKNKSLSAFTIVELLVVIVIIGILAAIVLVSYGYVQQNAVAASLQSDLNNASQQLNLFHMDNGVYPTTISTNCATQPDNPPINKCLKISNGNSYTYNFDNTTSSGKYGLTATNANWKLSFRTVKDSGVVACAPGFIIVPGSKTYGTSNFCVMKYEASHSDAGVGSQGTSIIPISKVGVMQWGGASQTVAMTNSPNVSGCSGCHLITEAEWLTIAQNVLSVPSNWTSGVVGTGSIFSGHNNSAPWSPLLTNSDDLGYNGETSPDTNQRRTLTLTNGEVIWDLAGNIDEWTSGQTNGTTAQMPGKTGVTYPAQTQWNTVNVSGSLVPSPLPSATGISGAASWDSSTGIGKLVSDTTDTRRAGCLRSGYWNLGGYAGVLALEFGYDPGDSEVFTGFRVAR